MGAAAVNHGVWEINWVDLGREPREPPNPTYPSGMDISISTADPACKRALPYPAKRCGYYAIKCLTCGATAIVTTAGRPDDPRSLRLSCKTMTH